MILPGLLIFASYSCICVAYAASQSLPKSPAPQSGAFAAAPLPGCRCSAGTGAPLFHLSAPGLSLSAAGTKLEAARAHHPRQDRIYCQTESGSGLASAAPCSRHPPEPERDQIRIQFDSKCDLGGGDGQPTIHSGACAASGISAGSFTGPQTYSGLPVPGTGSGPGTGRPPGESA